MLLKEASKTKNNQELVKASIDVLVKALEEGHSEALSSYLTAMAQFHNYSFQNILLIASKRPTATKVAGIRSWNELGRRVRRGEKRILPFCSLPTSDRGQRPQMVTADHRQRSVFWARFASVRSLSDKAFSGI